MEMNDLGDYLHYVIKKPNVDFIKYKF